jgi:hypothetical protein
MTLYSYDGPVLEFEKIVADHWKAKTYAKSEKQARNNLAYQFKTQTGRVARSRISVPGKIIAQGEELI